MGRKGFFSTILVLVTLFFDSNTLCYAEDDLTCLTGVVYYRCGANKPYPTIKATSAKCGPATSSNVTRQCYWSERADPRIKFKDCVIKRGGCSLTPTCGAEDEEVLAHQELKGRHCCSTPNCNTELNEEPVKELEQATLIAWVLLITFGTILGVGFVGTFTVCLVLCILRMRRDRAGSASSVQVHVSPPSEGTMAVVHGESAIVTGFIPMASSTTIPDDEIVPVAAIVITDTSQLSAPSTSQPTNAPPKKARTVVEV